MLVCYHYDYIYYYYSIAWVSLLSLLTVLVQCASLLSVLVINVDGVHYILLCWPVLAAECNIS